MSVERSTPHSWVVFLVVGMTEGASDYFAANDASQFISKFISQFNCVAESRCLPFYNKADTDR